MLPSWACSIPSQTEPLPQIDGAACGCHATECSALEPQFGREVHVDGDGHAAARRLHEIAECARRGVGMAPTGFGRIKSVAGAIVEVDTSTLERS